MTLMFKKVSLLERLMTLEPLGLFLTLSPVPDRDGHGIFASHSKASGFPLTALLIPQASCYSFLHSQ
jgi:hypothetical protein